MESIIISEYHLEKLVQHARQGYPEEVCGILAGRNNRVIEVLQMSNIEHSPASYFMASKEQFQVMKAIRERGLQMVAIYHSHPESPAYPSARDTRLAFYDDLAYIIISLLNKEPVVKSFSIRDGKVEEIKIERHEDSL